MQRVAVIDYGGSNLRSVAKALETVGDGEHDVVVTADASIIRSAERVVFPGQGAVGDCMRALAACELTDVVRECIQSRPFLGICLGLQSLMSFSEEDGGTDCLDILPGQVTRFEHDPPPAADGTPQKVPHMGWNTVRWSRPHPLVDETRDDERFYFVHSYYVEPEDADIVLGTTAYITEFTSAVAHGSAVATQFHPEKSAAAGLALLQRFLAWDGTA